MIPSFEPVITNLLLTSVRRGSSPSSSALWRIILTSQSLTCQPVLQLNCTSSTSLVQGRFGWLVSLLNACNIQHSDCQTEMTFCLISTFITVSSLNNSTNLNDRHCISQQNQTRSSHLTQMFVVVVMSLQQNLYSIQWCSGCFGTTSCDTFPRGEKKATGCQSSSSQQLNKGFPNAFSNGVAERKLTQEVEKAPIR